MGASERYDLEEEIEHQMERVKTKRRGVKQNKLQSYYYFKLILTRRAKSSQRNVDNDKLDYTSIQAHVHVHLVCSL